MMIRCKETLSERVKTMAKLLLSANVSRAYSGEQISEGDQLYHSM